jgi:glycosyltransferase involved in cell wall biosynthesis
VVALAGAGTASAARAAAWTSEAAPREAAYGFGGGLAAAVCTRGRPAALARAVRSLIAQSEPLAEILIIDQAQPGEPSAALIAAELGSYVAAVRYVREMRPGPGAARNRALRMCRHPFLAFLDDDAIAHGAWSAQLRRTFDDPAVAACTGRVESRSDAGAAGSRIEVHGGSGRVVLPRDAAGRLNGRRMPLIAWAVSVASGCGLAVRVDAALAAGGFDEQLDDGDALRGAGDHDLLWRLLLAGRSVVSEPQAVAWREQRAGAAEASVAGRQRGVVAFLVKSLARAPRRHAPGVVVFLAWRLMEPGARLVRRAAGRDPLPARALLAMWLDCCRGLAACRIGASES